MAKPAIQASFNAGEWAPQLYGRVDLQKYHSGAALIRNFFVDYRGGVTASPGSKYILQTINANSAVRLIPFQASLSVSYVLVFENAKLWFISNGTPVVETGVSITGITKANPGVVTAGSHGFSNGDRVYISGVGGMTEVNGNYYTVANKTANTFELTDLSGNNVNTSSYTTYTTGGSASRIYTLASPYAAAELAQVNYAQDVNVMVLCHPNYAPYKLTLTSATSWTLAAMTIGSTISAPAGQSVSTTLGAGTWNYAYVITAVDANGQESAPSSFATLAATLDIRATAGSNTITWSAVTGAVSYNVYKAEIRQTTAVPAGSAFGFIGNCTATTFIDSNIAPDFSQSYPIVRNPFFGSGVQTITVTAAGSYSNGQSIPTVSFSGGGGGSGAAAIATASATSISLSAAGLGYSVGNVLYLGYGVIIQVTNVSSPGGEIQHFVVANAGSLNSGDVTLTNPSPVFGGTYTGSGATFNITWGVTAVNLTSGGAGYSPAPTVVFSSGAAAATATLGAAASGNPTVPAYHQQRLYLMGPVASPNQLNASQPGAPYNFNVHDPILPDSAFQGTLNSGQLNTIRSAVSQPQGLVILSDRQAWLLNGGSAGSAISAIDLVANAQIFNGAGAPPPIVAVDDILYVQAKNSIVRDLIFNWNKQVYTGADISVQSAHLFYGYQILEWAYAEEPYKLVWAVRNDGVLLTLTFLKEQELVAWAHRDTQGSYKSVASVTEAVDLGTVDAVYVVVQRTINGSTVQYIERFQEQYYPDGVTDAWQVDSGLQYNGTATTSFSGLQHLATEDVVGLATDDTGEVTTFTATISSTGTFSLAAPPSPATGYTRVTVGLAYTPQLQTLPIDTGDPTIQGKMKFLPQVDLKVYQTLGLQIGSDADNLVDMDDLIVGNVGKQTNEEVTGLVSGDALQALDPGWTVPGQYFIQQSLPYPASILAVIPQIEVANPRE